MKHLIFLFLLPLSIFSYAQAVDEVPDAEKIYEFCEIQPSFPGGPDSLTAFIKSNINYPIMSLEAGEQGIVYMQFVVTKTGEITKIIIKRGVSEPLDKEARRVISVMPNWIPGKQNGENINVRYIVPIHFRISDPLNDN